MPIPSFQAVHTNSSTFATTLTGSFNVGANPATILAFALAEGGASAVRVDSIVIGGQTMTAYTDRSMQTEYGAAGRCRGFGLIASSLTGTQSYTLSCTNLSGTPDGNAKPAVIFVVYRDGASATSASRAGVAVSAGNTFSSTIASSATARAIFVGFRGASAVTATAPTVKDADQSMGSYVGLALSEDGATSSTLEAVSTSTDAYIGQLWSVEGGSSGPTLTAPTGVATSSTGATIGATTDTASGIIYGVVTTSATAPTQAQIAAGQDHTGATAAASGNTGTLTTSGVKTINVAGLTASTTYRAHLYHDDASGDSAVVTSAAFITDVTSPSLTAQTASSAAPLTCQGSVSTNEGNGTLYAVVTASATAPSAAQVKAGQDHTGAAALRVISQAVSGTGTQSIASGAVTAGTRYMHFMHEDAAANQSAVVSSASFVVAATFTITSDALEDETGAVLASVALTRAYAIRLSDHTLVASWASPATNGSGQLVLADAALTAVPHLLATVSNSNADAGAKVYTPG